MSSNNNEKPNIGCIILTGLAIISGIIYSIATSLSVQFAEKRLFIISIIALPTAYFAFKWISSLESSSKVLKIIAAVVAMVVGIGIILFF